jgi:hypothetical protein
MTAPRGVGARTAFGPNAALAALVLTSVIAMATFREMALGKTEMAAAEEAVARSDWPEAVWHARAAAEAFVPGSPWPERAMLRLETIAREAATRGDRDVALLAYGALRTASLATRAPGATDARWRLLAEDGLTRLAVRPDAPQPLESANAMRADLKEAGMPSVWTFAALSASVVTILVGLARLAVVAWLSPQAFAAKVLVAAGFAMYTAVLLLS